MIHRSALIVALLTGAFSSGITLYTSSSYASTEDEQELFFVAQKAFEDGFYDVSIRYINQFLDNFPRSQRSIEAKILLGQCYFFKTQYLKSYNIFNALKGAASNQDAVLFWLGETFSKNNEVEQAVDHYQELIDVFESSLYRPQAMYSLAWLLFEKQNYQQAREYFTTLIHEYPKHHLVEDARIKIAESYYNLGEYEQAIMYFEAYLEQYPQSDRTGEVNFNIAEAYYAMEKYEPAIEYYRRMQETSIDKTTLLSAKISQGWSYMKLGEYDQARKVLDDAEIFAEENGLTLEEVLIAQASLYTDSEFFDEAIDSFNQLIKEFPQSHRVADAYLGRANTFYVKEDYKSAIDDYKFIIQQFNGIEDYNDVVEKARFGLAWTHLKSGDIDGAINHFEGVLEKAKSNAVKVSALTQIGDAYQEVGELDKSVQIYDDILKDYPDSPYADYVQYRQGVALLKLKKFDSALLSFGSLKANFPQSRYNNDVDYYLGVTYFQKGDWNGAKEVLSKFTANIVKENEFAAEAYYILGLTHFNLDEYKKALSVFNQMESLFPEDRILVANVEVSKAKVLYEMGREDDAIKLFTTIAEKYSAGDAPEEALIWLGGHYVNKKEYNQGQAYYNRFIKLFPESKRLPAVYYELGRSYEFLSEWDDAVAAYRRVVDFDVPADVEAQAKLAIGNIFSKQFSLEEAKHIYISIIRKNPEYKRNAHMNLADLYKKNREFTKAVASYTDALNAKKGDSEISQAELYFALGDTYELMNQPEDAIEQYLKIPYLTQRKQQWIVRAYLRVGRLFENQEKWEEAKTIYRKLVDLKTEESKYAQERIQWIDQNTTG